MKLRFDLVKDCEILIVYTLIKELKVDPQAIIPKQLWLGRVFRATPMKSSQFRPIGESCFMSQLGTIPLWLGILMTCGHALRARRKEPSSHGALLGFCIFKVNHIVRFANLLYEASIKQKKTQERHHEMEMILACLYIL